MLQSLFRKPAMVTPENALPGRAEPLRVEPVHAVLGTSIVGPYPQGSQELVLGLGCFWGAERLFWQLPGVHTTSAGYAGGLTPNPTYEETCTGRTGHAEVVHVVFDPQVLPLEQVLKTFWEGHDPTQGNRQGNDVGTQYRSAIYTSDEQQLATVLASRDAYAKSLSAGGYGPITTEIAPRGDYYLAETYHQQYLHKNPGGYCGLGGTGVACQLGTGVQS